MKTLLFIDATIRSEEESRTWELCQTYLESWKAENPGGTIEHLRLRDQNLRPCLAGDIELREDLWSCTKELKHLHSLVRYPGQFAQADQILIGAPYWDLSFPALLRIYLEKVCTPGCTFCYTEQGVKPLCRASDCIYITACGGNPDCNLGADYIRELCRCLFGIPNFYQASANGLDIEGADIAGIMAQTKKEIRELVGRQGEHPDSTCFLSV